MPDAQAGVERPSVGARNGAPVCCKNSTLHRADTLASDSRIFRSRATVC